jgi:hypothetical protein
LVLSLARSEAAATIIPVCGPLHPRDCSGKVVRLNLCSNTRQNAIP